MLAGNSGRDLVALAASPGSFLGSKLPNGVVLIGLFPGGSIPSSVPNRRDASTTGAAATPKRAQTNSRRPQLSCCGVAERQGGCRNLRMWHVELKGPAERLLAKLRSHE